MLDLGFFTLRWGQRFNSEIEYDGFRNKVEFWWFLIEATIKTLSVTFFCIDSYGVNLGYEWYKLYAFGQPEE